MTEAGPAFTSDVPPNAMARLALHRPPVLLFLEYMLLTCPAAQYSSHEHEYDPEARLYCGSVRGGLRDFGSTTLNAAAARAGGWDVLKSQRFFRASDLGTGKCRQACDFPPPVWPFN